MARNKDPKYIKKLIATEAPNGYKFDLANYLYNPSYDCEYPAFHKVIAEDENTQTIRRYYYFKYHNGAGEYIVDTYQRPKTDGWAVTKQRESEVLAEANRFSLNKLLSLIPA